MKRILIFLAVFILLSGTALQSLQAQEEVEEIMIEVKDLVEVPVDEVEYVASASGYPTRQFYYDLTQITNSPSQYPAVSALSCSTGQMNVWLDTRGFGSYVTTRPVWGLMMYGRWHLYFGSHAYPVAPGKRIGFFARVQGSGVVTNGLYAAGFEYPVGSRRIYTNYRHYPAYIYCP